MTKIINRRTNALVRLQKQLVKGTKLQKYNVVPLTPEDITRINQEIANIKAK